MARLAIIGAGYVGLTTAACFAHLGHDVVCADLDEQRIAALTRGEVPIVETEVTVEIMRTTPGCPAKDSTGSCDGAVGRCRG